MNSLVSADYGSSSDEYASDEENSSKTDDKIQNFLRSASDSDPNDSFGSSDEQNDTNTTKKDVLPSASSILLNGNQTGQVFNNPYKKAEIEQLASLEKHVKMVDTDANTQMKNGKKICWNYRKGRCRFGSNCAYAHDSDLHEKIDGANAGEPTHATATKKQSNNKKRSGLGDSIIPSKKVMKLYNSLKK